MKKGFYWKNPYLLILPKYKKKETKKILLQAVVKWMIWQQRGDFVNSNIYNISLKKMIILKFYNACEGDNYLIVHTGIPIFISFFIDK